MPCALAAWPASLPDLRWSMTLTAVRRSCRATDASGDRASTGRYAARSGGHARLKLLLDLEVEERLRIRLVAQREVPPLRRVGLEAVLLHQRPQHEPLRLLVDHHAGIFNVGQRVEAVVPRA